MSKTCVLIPTLIEYVSFLPLSCEDNLNTLIHEFFIFAKFPHFLTKSSEIPVEIGDAESEEIVRK